LFFRSKKDSKLALLVSMASTDKRCMICYNSTCATRSSTSCVRRLYDCYLLPCIWSLSTSSLFS